MPKRSSSTLDDLFIYVYEAEPVRAKDMEQVFVKTKKMSRGTLYKYKRILENHRKIQSTPVHARPLYCLFHVPESHHHEAELLRQYRSLPITTYFNHVNSARAS
jgi:hypothetical protein